MLTDDVSACLIVKNCADTLSITLDWLLGEFNEICMVVDPQNYDDTLAIVDSYHEKNENKLIVQIRPFDDFSTQMNVCLKMATRNYICIASGDEIMEDIPWDKLIIMMRKNSGEIVAFPRLNLQKNLNFVRPIGYPDHQFRFFKNFCNIKMNGKVVDETLDISNRRVIFMPFHIIHFGHLRPKEALLQKGKDRIKFAQQDGCDGVGFQVHGDEWFYMRNESWDHEIKPIPTEFKYQIEKLVPKDHWLRSL